MLATIIFILWFVSCIVLASIAADKWDKKPRPVYAVACGISAGVLFSSMAVFGFIMLITIRLGLVCGA